MSRHAPSDFGTVRYERARAVCLRLEIELERVRLERMRFEVDVQNAQHARERNAVFARTN
jgi:hypothetical protein